MTAPRITTEQCRYVRRNDQRCTAEVADPDAEILLCLKHMARAFTTVQAKAKALGVTRGI